KNKIAAIVRKTGAQPPTKTAFGVRSRQFLATVPVRACYWLTLDGYLRQLDQLTTEIRGADHAIAEQVAAEAQAQLFCTIPGIGAYSPLLIRSEIGDSARFPTGGACAPIQELVPAVHASADK